ncbi:U32 family peptidase [Clostridium sp. BJN0001]|uniref:DUF3656 domain-containing U32 family peptidase n=1 Tax=Clostridium sp. BJN0001 TaxID=2930219 RepID=UPI001FCFCFAA|nr:U32 family peptidase [Clostridium sp. BJN0001]
MKNIEVLAPAGSMESLIAAVNNGADAIYLGGDKFSARAYASNFDDDNMKKAVDYAHIYNVKIYVTINTILKDDEIKKAADYAAFLYEIGVDALIIQDTGLINILRKTYPDFELHASTQMTIHNPEGALYFNKKGLKRIVLSRELSLNEIKYISNDLNIETEIFVHGALCVCYSGQCLMSSMIGTRSGNRGRCAQPCRMLYTIKGKKGEEKKGYLLSTKDTCLIDNIEDIVKSGTSSLKIEGRMKKPEYVAGVTKSYRNAVDKYLKNSKYDIKNGKEMLLKLFNREGFAKAYLYKNTGKDMMSFNYPKNTGVRIGQVKDNGEVLLERDVALGDGIRFLEKGFTLSKIIVNGNEKNEAFKGQSVKLFPKNGYKKGNILYKTSDKMMIDSLDKDIKSYEKKINLKAEVIFKTNEPLKIKTEYEGNIYEVYGDIVEKAQSSPLSKERIEKALKKSGDVAYKFSDIIFSAFEEGFVRISSLNSLRRDLFNKISDQKISSYRRLPDKKEFTFEKNKSQKEIGIIYSCLFKEQLKALLENEKTLNIALNIFSSKYKNALGIEDIRKVDGKRIFISIPSVVKQEFNEIIKTIDSVKDSIDGIITSNAGIINHYKDEIFIIGDYKLNVFNTEALEFYLKDIDIVSLSLELTKSEIRKISEDRKKKTSAVNIYGKTELMVSEYCPIGSTFGNKSSNKSCNNACLKDEYCLIDRMNEKFFIYTDNSCRSHILNSVPTDIINEMDELKRFGICNFRVDFTTEDYNEVNYVLDEVYKKEERKDNNYTRGHYKRKVE